MPRDSNQVYTLPEAPFQTNTVAQPAAVNNNFSDIAAALTTSLTRGETTAFSRSLLDDPDASTARTTLGATTTGSALMTAADAAAARTALGATATGSAVLTAADAAAARTTLGATVTGTALLTAADAAAARTTLGATATGTALMTAASAAAARTTIGATATGSAVLTAADAAAARSTLSAPPAPTASAGVGQWTSIISGIGNSLSLPANGTWAFIQFNLNSTGQIVSFASGVEAGGTLIGGANVNINYVAAVWRIL